MHDLNITIVQTTLHWHDIDANLDMLESKVAGITEPTDLILLPEMFSTGFSMQAENHAEPMSGKSVAWLRQMAHEAHANIAGSLMISHEGRYYNRLVWCRPNGQLLTYDKRHLFAFAGEDTVYTAGQAHLTVTVKGWRIRPFICYDLRFPIWCRNLGNAYDLAIFTANWPAARANHWRTLLRARAIENQAFVIGINRVGIDGNGLAYVGDSALIDPSGTVLSEVHGEETRFTVRLVRETLKDYRAQFPFLKDADNNLVSVDQR
jgi:predicted amidohydrolase